MSDQGFPKTADRDPPAAQSSPSGSMPSARDLPWCRLLTFVGTAVMAGIIAVHFGLVNRAAWGGDEYTTFGNYRIGGLAYGWFRFWSWAPRPVSEILYALYGLVVLLTRMPLIVPLFVLGWIAFFCSASPTLLNRDRNGLASHVLGTIAILAFVLLGRRVFWVFYWPIALVAYMPVIAAAIFLLVSIVDEHPRRQFDSFGVVTTLILVATAWCSESGALVVLVFSSMALVYQFIWQRTTTPAMRIVLQWGPPIVAAMFVVLVSLGNNRAVAPMLASGDAAVFHNTLASLRASAALLPAEFLSLDGETFDTSNFVQGGLVRILFFAGIYCCWVTRDPAARRNRHWLPLLTLALVTELFLELAATFRQFGGTCCWQHNEVRYGVGLVALAALAIWLPPVPRVPEWVLRAAAPVLLVAAVVPLMLPRYQDLALDYVYWLEPEHVRGNTWDSGYSPGPTMTLYQPVPDSVFPAQIPPGYQVAKDNWWTQGILTFFGKDSVQVLIAEQHTR